MLCMFLAEAFNYILSRVKHHALIVKEVNNFDVRYRNICAIFIKDTFYSYRYTVCIHDLQYIACSALCMFASTLLSYELAPLFQSPLITCIIKSPGQKVYGNELSNERGKIMQ